MLTRNKTTQIFQSFHRHVTPPFYLLRKNCLEITHELFLSVELNLSPIFSVFLNLFVVFFLDLLLLFERCHSEIVLEYHSGIVFLRNGF